MQGGFVGGGHALSRTLGETPWQAMGWVSAPDAALQPHQLCLSGRWLHAGLVRLNISEVHLIKHMWTSAASVAGTANLYMSMDLEALSLISMSD